MTVPVLVLSPLSARVLVQSKDLLKILAKDLIYEGVTNKDNQMRLQNEQARIME